MEHHGGKLGRGEVNLKEVQKKIAGVTAKSKAIHAKMGEKKKSHKRFEKSIDDSNKRVGGTMGTFTNKPHDYK